MVCDGPGDCTPFCFAKDQAGLIFLVEHDEDTGGVMPIKLHTYRLPPFKKEKDREEFALD